MFKFFCKWQCRRLFCRAQKIATCTLLLKRRDDGFILPGKPPHYDIQEYVGASSGFACHVVPPAQHKAMIHFSHIILQPWSSQRNISCLPHLSTSQTLNVKCAKLGSYTMFRTTCFSNCWQSGAIRMLLRMKFVVHLPISQIPPYKSIFCSARRRSIDRYLLKFIWDR